MSETPDATEDGRWDDAGQYEVRLKGHLDPRWSAWFDGLMLTEDSDGTTVIHCSAIDQAALHGLLQKVRDIGLPLVSATRVDPNHPAVHPTHNRRPQ